MRKNFIITTAGGLGNQIMQYGLWLYLKKKGEKAEFYLCKDNLSGCLYKGDINRIDCVSRFLGKNYKVIQKCLGKLYHILKIRTKYYSFFNYRIIDFPQWNDYKVLYEILPLLRETLQFPQDNDNRNVEIKKLMQKTDSVSVHIRRGDYQNDIRWRLILGDICDAQYYNDAIAIVRKKFNSSKFFIFSDDIQWVKENLSIPNSVYIDWNVGDISFRDMELMTYCKANIIANSTFSLCAALMNGTEAPIRIAPSKWLNNINDDLGNKYLNKDWIVIDNKKPQVSLITKGNLSKENIKNLMKQTYNDFEVISSQVIDDKRFHNGKPSGNHILQLDQNVLISIRNKLFLKKWMEKQLQEGFA